MNPNILLIVCCHYLRFDDSLGSPELSGDLFLGRFDLFRQRKFILIMFSLYFWSILITVHYSGRHHYFQHHLLQMYYDHGFWNVHLGTSFHFHSSVHFFRVNVLCRIVVLWMYCVHVTNVSVVLNVALNDANVLLSDFAGTIYFQCL